MSEIIVRIDHLRVKPGTRLSATITGVTLVEKGETTAVLAPTDDRTFRLAADIPCSYKGCNTTYRVGKLSIVQLAWRWILFTTLLLIGAFFTSVFFKTLQHTSFDNNLWFMPALFFFLLAIALTPSLCRKLYIKGDFFQGQHQAVIVRRS